MTQYPPPASDPARARFIVIQALRWTGLALVMLGLLVLNRRIDLPEVVGGVFVVVGLVDALLMPTFLARRWKTPLP